MTELTFFCWQFRNYFFPEGKQARAYDGQTPQNEIFTLCYICHNCRDSDCLKKWQLRPAAPEFLAGSSLYTGYSTGFGDIWKVMAGWQWSNKSKLPEAKSGEMENILLDLFSNTMTTLVVHDISSKSAFVPLSVVKDCGCLQKML